MERILIADEGMFYTDGNTYGTTVILAPDADASVWKQVTEEELPKEEDEATEADYLAALARLGVE